MMLLGEIKSDLKWLVTELGQTRAEVVDTKSIVQHHAHRIDKLETKPHQSRIVWGPLLRYTAGAAPLAWALLSHKISLSEALTLAQGLLGLAGHS